MFKYHSIHTVYVTPRTGRFWMDDMHCNGNETEIKNCRFDGWGKNDCEASEAAGVVCKRSINVEQNVLNRTHSHKTARKHLLSRKYDVELRLTGGRNKYEGNVEVRERAREIHRVHAMFIDCNN